MVRRLCILRFSVARWPGVGLALSAGLTKAFKRNRRGLSLTASKLLCAVGRVIGRERGVREGARR